MAAHRARAAAIAAAIAVALSGCATSPGDDAQGLVDEAPVAVAGVVVAVVDGDTIDVDVNGREVERIRLIGIDAPEVGRGGATSECFAEESRDVLNERLYGERVVLVSDASQDPFDRYGRWLRYVQLEASGEDAALELLQAGGAVEYTYDTAHERQALYLEAEADAQRSGLGLWQPDCEAP